MSATFETWKETAIWKIISRNTEDDACILTLNSSMPKVESILKSGGTSSIDFTLHDHEHGFRVAQRMVDIIPKEVLNLMGSFELSLLLLSAYLHDIGMTPGRDVVDKHFKYAITGDSSLLTPSEMKDLQKWLDEERDGQELPVERNKITPSGVGEAEEIIAYYCRHKHNDWSELWIRENLSNLPNGLYPAWIDDLVTLCRSHHEGIAELRTDRFNSRMTGSPSQVVNLRYLAAVLRVADVLEFDPERTPNVVLKHRGIAAKSRIYWYKDKEISFQLDHDRHQMQISARTPDAAIHKAVIDTSRWVDQELLCCSALQQEGAFYRGSVPDNYRFHSWPWPAKLALDISERDKSFVFIDGAFRPNTKQILELLSGTSLYGNPFAAIRELLQNAFDAVKEQIARERLSQDDPDNSIWEEHLGRTNKVSLTIEKDNDGHWLVCNDSGVGMTKHIIEKYLLVSGSTRQADVIALERAARKKGFSSGRTGQFGIGVLSYFMIADQLVVRTRRSGEALGDPDNTGWQFSISGIDTFGQLSRISRSSRGTEVRLRIKLGSEHTDMAQWAREAEEYIKYTVRVIPCRFEVRLSEPSPSDTQTFGWIKHMDRYRDIVIKNLQLFRNEYGYEKIITSNQVSKRKHADEQWNNIQDIFKKSMVISVLDEGKLPNCIGSYRISVPYFSISGKNSLAFFIEDSDGVRLFPDGRSIAIPNKMYSVSWKGISIRNEPHIINGRPYYSNHDDIFEFKSEIPFIVEIDLVEGANISVSRNEIDIKDNKKLISDFVSSKLKDATKHFIDNLDQKDTSLLNWAILKPEKDFPEKFSPGDLRYPINKYAGDRSGGNTYSWMTVTGPIAEPIDTLKFLTPKGSDLKWNGININIVERLNSENSRDELSTMQRYACNQLAMIRTEYGGFSLCSLWHDISTAKIGKNSKEKNECDFPPEWKNVCVIRSSSRAFWNRNNGIIREIDSEAIEWSSEIDINSEDDFESIIKQASMTKSRSAMWFTINSNKGVRIMQAMDDHFPREAAIIKRNIYDCVGGDQFPVVTFYFSSSFIGMAQSIILDKNTWLSFEYNEFTEGEMVIGEKHLLLPIPSDEKYWIGEKFFLDEGKDQD